MIATASSSIPPLIDLLEIIGVSSVPPLPDLLQIYGAGGATVGGYIGWCVPSARTIRAMLDNVSRGAVAGGALGAIVAFVIDAIAGAR